MRMRASRCSRGSIDKPRRTSSSSRALSARSLATRVSAATAGSRAVARHDRRLPEMNWFRRMKNVQALRFVPSVKLARALSAFSRVSCARSSPSVALPLSERPNARSCGMRAMRSRSKARRSASDVVMVKLPVSL